MTALANNWDVTVSTVSVEAERIEIAPGSAHINVCSMKDFVAQARVAHVECMCNHWGLDLTVGCEHGCIYCPFHRYQSLTMHHAHSGPPLAKSLSVEEFLKQDKYPPTLYLSPFTDPLAPAARGNLERVLGRVLPKGVRVGISTKGVLPRRLFRMLSDWADQVLLFVGLASLDDERNRSVEPGCPPAHDRLENLRLARQHGLTKVSARLDPLLPDVDDTPDRLRSVLDGVAGAGAKQVAATYLFLLLRTNRRQLQRVPYLDRALTACVEICPVQNGVVYSVPLERKQRTYEWLHRECLERGLAFATCGCKDFRLQSGTYATHCASPY